MEQSVFEILQDCDTMAHLKADAIMFHHVYCNVVMLAKSNHLDKNVLDMNQHYLELQVFLAEVEHDPETAMNRNFEVFVSEKRLYGNDKKVNHHLHASYEVVEGKIFSEDATDKRLLHPLLKSSHHMLKTNY